jgi:hypothetical protein
VAAMISTCQIAQTLLTCGKTVMIMENFGEIILYRPDDEVKLEVRIEEETVWLTQAQMAQLFQTTKQNISLHINNIFKEHELDRVSVVKDFLTTASDGKSYRVMCFNLDVIISVGYRVKSLRGTQFRQWANGVLKEHLLKGYSINRRLTELEHIVSEQGKKIDFFVRTSLPPVEGVFYNGQIFDAYSFATGLIRSPHKSILLIDNYIDESVLLMLAKRSDGVSADIYTRSPDKQLTLDLEKHNKQYPPVQLHASSGIHDRFFILDDAEVYHIGASLKDLGKKMFAFSRLQIEPAVILAALK